MHGTARASFDLAALCGCHTLNIYFVCLFMGNSVSVEVLEKRLVRSCFADLACSGSHLVAIMLHGICSHG